MRVIEGFKGGMEAQEGEPGDALEFLEASKAWPTREMLEQYPHTHGAAGHAIGGVISWVLSTLGIEK